MKKSRFKKISLTCFCLLLFVSLWADEMRVNVYNLGYSLGRPCSQGLRDNDMLAVNSRIMQNVRSYLNDAIRLAQQLEIDSAGIDLFKQNCEQYTRSQYMTQGRILMDNLQQICNTNFGEEGAVIFTMGIWMGGAECTAAFGAGFDRSQRPGTYALIQRNVGWMRDNAPRISLDTRQINRLFDNMNRDPGVSFSSARSSLRRIREDWITELRQQPSFFQLVNLTDATWESEVLQSSIPVLVVFGPSYDVPSRRMIKVIEGMLKEYLGRVKFAIAPLPQCKGTYQKMRVMAFPTLLLFKGGNQIARKQGGQSEAAIRALIDANLESEGLLGIKMAKPIKK